MKTNAILQHRPKEDGRAEDEEEEEEEVDAKPPIVTCHPHPPTYTIPGTRGIHHDMMMIMVESEVMAMRVGIGLLHRR